MQMDLKKFSDELEYLSKSDNELLRDFVMTESIDSDKDTPVSRSMIEAKPSELTLDKTIIISQTSKDGEIKEYQFKISEIWSAPENFFSLLSLSEVNDGINIWTLFFLKNKGTWYLKKANKGIVNVHVFII